MPTMQQIVDAARYPLNDDAKDRYADALLLGFANRARRELLRVRPDLFIPTFAAADLALGDAFDVDARYEQPVIDYVTMRASLTDDEFTANGKAQAFLMLAIAGAKNG